MLSIVTVNYKSEKYLERCLSSLYNYLEEDSFESMVVNNDKDADLKKIEEKFPQTKIINNDGNVGFGAANNAGVKKATGEVLLFLNPDAEIISSNINDLLSKFDKDVAVIGPRLVTDENKTQEWSAGKEFSLKQLIKNNLGFVENRKIWESKQEVITDWVSGAALFVRKKEFEEAGGFDEKFFMYFEDEDLCRKIRKNGHQVLYFPEFSVLHHGGKSRNGRISQKKQFLKSMLYFFWKRVSNV